MVEFGTDLSHLYYFFGELAEGPVMYLSET